MADHDNGLSTDSPSSSRLSSRRLAVNRALADALGTRLGTRLSESIPSRRSSIKSQEAMWDVPRGGHHYVRIHDSARKRDILFLVPTQHLVQQGMLFSARVHFERPEPGPGFLENCAKVSADLDSRTLDFLSSSPSP